jgi:hypothetical protein
MGFKKRYLPAAALIGCLFQAACAQFPSFAAPAVEPRAPRPMSPALAEFLSIRLNSLFIDERTAFTREFSALTPEQQQRKALQMYRAEHGGNKPPALSASGAGTERLLQNYPSSPALDAVIRAHAGSTALFYAPWFPEHMARAPEDRAAGNPGFAQELIVTASGKIWSQRRIRSWAAQGGGTMKPNEEVRAAIEQTVRTLPQSDAQPALGRLLIVTCRTENGWQTRLYDRANLPEPVRGVFERTRGRMTGSRP